jgi:putative cofactor-binding repeat protein
MKAQRLLYLLLFSLILLLFCAGNVAADTPVSGFIESDTTWTLAESPYLVTGNALVSEGVSLTIEPGVVIKFDSGFSLQIDGELVARGTESQLITFTSNQPSPAPGDWGYILFSDTSTDATYDVDGNYTSGSVLEYCVVDFAGGLSVNNNGALRLDNAHPSINHCTIQNSAALGIIAWNLSGVLNIANSTIQFNSGRGILTKGVTYSVGGGYRTDPGGTVTIAGNTISGNLEGGINCYPELGTITNNSIIGNSADTGGGIYSRGWVTISKNIIRENSSLSWGKGGGIFTSGGASINNNIIASNYSVLDGGGIYTYSASITDNIIIDNLAARQGGGIWIIYDTAITGNTIRRNSAPNSSALYYWDGSLDLKNNTIIDNITTGPAPTYTVWISQHPIFNNNNIFNNNATYDLWNDNSLGTNNVDATSNWWGTAVESEIKGKIYDWLDDATKGIVDYAPFLTEHDTTAPISPPANLVESIDGDTINLSWTANPEADVAGYKIYYDSDSGFPYANEIDVGNVTSYPLSGLPGGTYIAVTAYDDGVTPAAVGDDPSTIVNENQTNGNESWFSTELLVDQPEISINTGDPYTNSVNVTLSVSFSHSDSVSGYLASEDPTTPAEDDSRWISIPLINDYIDDVDFVLSEGDGDKTVYLWFKSSNDSISLSNNDSIYLDTSAPSGSVTVNSNDSFTTSTDVTLNLSADDLEGVIGYYASLNATPPLPGDSGWSPISSTTNYSGDVSFSLSATDGLQTVYVWFKDAATNVSSVTSDTIILDTGPPTGAVSISGGAGAVNSTAVTLDVTASDSGTAGIQMAFSNDGANFSPWVDYSTAQNWSLPSGNGTKTVYAKFKDLAGFESTTYSDTTLLDTYEPTAAITLPEDGSYVTSLLAIAGTASDLSPSSGLAAVEIQVTTGSVYLRPDGTWGVNPIFFTPDGGTFSAWNHDTNQVSWDINTTYTITARATDFAGNTSTTLSTVTYGIKKDPSTITCALSSNNITLGEAFQISGQITPVPSQMGAFVSVELIPPSGPAKQTSVIANAQGQFSYDVACGDISREGTWTVRSSWAGDEVLEAAISENKSLEVAKAESRVTLDITSQAIKLGDLVSISGKFTPQPDCGADLSGIPVLLVLSGPGGTDTQSTVTNDQWGHFLLQDYGGFDGLGEWTVQAVFAGNHAYDASSSMLVDLKVVETAGYGIVVQGKISSAEGIDSHNKTANSVYSKLKDRGLLDDDIRYFNYDTAQPGVYGTPVKAAIREAITQWARDKMNERPANLYIVLVDHGLEDVFYIHPDSITSTELADWLDTLQASLTGTDAAYQEIVIILGFCRSGSFIDNLSGNHRVIITSAAKHESSYKGPLDEDGIREGEYFVSEFFKSVSLGKSVKTCFEEATTLTEIFTASGSGDSTNAPYYDESLQHPLLDDNGDGVGSNALDDPDGDGVFSEDLFIGVSSVTGNDPGDVAVIQVAETTFLSEVEDAVNLWARVDDNTRLRTIWIELKPPNYQPVDPGGSGQAEMDLPKTPTVDYNSPADRYQWNGLGGFTDPGTYQVFYFAKDDITENVSPLMETKVYKAKIGNAPPNAFSLVSPHDGASVLTTLVLDWQDTTDPDGDSLSYTVLFSKGDDSFSNPIRIEDLDYSTCLVSPAHGIEDLSTYYWKVQAIDEYGAIQETAVRVFHTNNTNPVAAWINGHVYDSFSGQSIASAVVSVGNVELTSASGGYYLGLVPPGTYTITASATGYKAKSYPDVTIPDADLVTKDFALLREGSASLGDIDGSLAVDLTDAILALQVMAGIQPSATIFLEADVNYDGRVGLEEAIYIMQRVAGVR